MSTGRIKRGDIRKLLRRQGTRTPVAGFPSKMAAVEALSAQGLSSTDIAQRIGSSVESVCNMLRRITPNADRAASASGNKSKVSTVASMMSEGATADEIADRLGWKIESVRSAMSRIRNGKATSKGRANG